jgi:hypothetical protein
MKKVLLQVYYLLISKNKKLKFEHFSSDIFDQRHRKLYNCLVAFFVFMVEV